jgi:hypothetical protein
VAAAFAGEPRALGLAVVARRALQPAARLRAAASGATLCLLGAVPGGEEGC